MLAHYHIRVPARSLLQFSPRLVCVEMTTDENNDHHRDEVYDDQRKNNIFCVYRSRFDYLRPVARGIGMLIECFAKILKSVKKKSIG